MDATDFREMTVQNDAEWFEALVSLARFLRSPKGCPWDRKQSALSFARYAQEECGEFIEALEKDGADGGPGGNEHAAEEWGDTFFVLLAALAAAEEEGRFVLGDAMRRAYEKMIRRHDHIFGEHTAASAEDAVDVWNKMKAREKTSQAEAREKAKKSGQIVDGGNGE